MTGAAKKIADRANTNVMQRSAEFIIEVSRKSQVGRIDPNPRTGITRVSQLHVAPVRPIPDDRNNCVHRISRNLSLGEKSSSRIVTLKRIDAMHDHTLIYPNN